MNDKKIRLVSIVINFVILLMAFVSWFVMMFFSTGNLSASGLGSLKYFTVLSNLLVGLASGVMGVFQIIALKNDENIPLWVLLFKYAGTVSVTLTLLVVVCYLAPNQVINGGSYFSMFIGANLFFHLIIPICSIVDFTFFEFKPSLHFKHTIIGIFPMLAYAIFYLFNVSFKGVASEFDGVKTYDWYGFFGDGNPIRIIIVVLIMLIATYSISLLVYFLNTISRHHFIGYDYDEEEEVPVETKEEDSSDVLEEEIIEDKIIGHVGDGTVVPDMNKRTIKSRNDGFDEVTETYTTNTGTIHTITKKVIRKYKEEHKKTTSTRTTEKLNRYKDGARTYHISKHLLSNSWQVKLANGEKAIKLFNTQREAIDYAKQLVTTQGGSIRIHSKKGKIRKE